jgi:acylphosphatase
VADDRPVTDAGARGPARERLDATVRGRVQGVGYRVFALREAMALGVDGYVANEVDGSVRVVAEGGRRDLEALLARLQDGPPAAIVDRVTARWEPARGPGGGFRIESRGHRGD